MKLIKLLLGLVLLLVIGVVVLGLFADSLTKKAIEAGGTYALGVDTKVDATDVGFLSQTFSLEGLNVANPQGFGDDSFLTLGKGTVALSAASLLSDTIEIPSIDLSQIRVQLVQSLGGGNYEKILDNLERLQGGDDASASEEGKRLLVEKLTLTDIQVEVVAVPELRLTAVQVPIEKIELEDIGTASGEGVLLSDLAGIVVEAILKRASASGRLPSLIQGGLDGQLRDLHGLRDAGIQALEGLLPGGTSGGAADAVREGLRGLGVGR